MLRCFTVVLLAFAIAPALQAEGAVTSPRDVPPVVATAVADGDEANLQIRLTCPRTKWRKVGQAVPQAEWPELRVEVEQETRTLVLGGPSARGESRVVDVEGHELRGEEVLSRLSTETPVLVSVSGKMVDSYYLQTTKPDTLVILLGPRDGVPAPRLLPSAATRTTSYGVVPAVYDERPRWRSVIIRRDGHNVRNRLRGVLGVGEG